MKKTWLSAILNFCFMGAGYIYNGKRVLSGVLITIASLGIYYFEQCYKFPDGNSMPVHDPNALTFIGLCVLVLNTGLAIDAYQEAKEINQSKKAQ